MNQLYRKHWIERFQPFSNSMQNSSGSSIAPARARQRPALDTGQQIILLILLLFLHILHYQMQLSQDFASTYRALEFPLLCV